MSEICKECHGKPFFCGQCSRAMDDKRWQDLKKYINDASYESEWHDGHIYGDILKQMEELER